MITDLDAPVWTGREPCRDPSNDREWWTADPTLGAGKGSTVQAKKDRVKAQWLCQDCPHSSWLLCARKALEGESTRAPAFGVWAGVWIDAVTNPHKKAAREEAIAEIRAIAATGLGKIFVPPSTAPPKIRRRKPRVHTGGRPKAMDAAKIMLARQMHDTGATFAKIGVEMGCSAATVHRALREGYKT